jgi:hypothetical protein
MHECSNATALLVQLTAELCAKAQYVLLLYIVLLPPSWQAAALHSQEQH